MALLGFPAAKGTLLELPKAERQQAPSMPFRTRRSLKGHPTNLGSNPNAALTQDPT